MALPLRGGMPPKKIRCSFKDCKDAAQRIVAAAVVKSGVVGPEGIAETAVKYADDWPSEPGVARNGVSGCNCGG